MEVDDSESASDIQAPKVSRCEKTAASDTENSKAANVDSDTSELCERGGYAPDKLPNGETKDVVCDKYNTDTSGETEPNYVGVAPVNFDADSVDDSDEEQGRLHVDLDASDKEDDTKIDHGENSALSRICKSLIDQSSEAFLGFRQPELRITNEFKLIKDGFRSESSFLPEGNFKYVCTVNSISDFISDDAGSKHSLNVRKSEQSELDSVESDAESIKNALELAKDATSIKSKPDIISSDLDSGTEATKMDVEHKPNISSIDSKSEVKTKSSNSVHNDPNKSGDSLETTSSNSTPSKADEGSGFPSLPIENASSERTPSSTDSSVSILGPNRTPSSRGSSPALFGRDSPASRSRKRNTLFLSDPIYRRPFELGWKRELVYRNSLDPNSKRQGDIYYYTPEGKKVRSTRELEDYLDGKILSVHNFTFCKEPIGLDAPFETIRTAGQKGTKDQKPAKSKRIKVAATPSVKSTSTSPGVESPKLAETRKKTITTVAAVRNFPKIKVTPTNAEREAAAAEKKAYSVKPPVAPSNLSEASRAFLGFSRTVEASAMPPMAKVSTTMPPLTKVSTSVPPLIKVPTTMPPLAKISTVPATAKSVFAPKVIAKPGGRMKQPAKTDLEMGMLPPMWKSETPASGSTTAANIATVATPSAPPAAKKPVTSPPAVMKENEPCSIRCPGMEGVVPSLQCRVCLCLYHSQCAGLGTVRTAIHSFVCKFCQKEIKEGKVVPVPKAKAAKLTDLTNGSPPLLTSLSTIKSNLSKNQDTPKIAVELLSKSQRSSQQIHKVIGVSKYAKVPKTKEQDMSSKPSMPSQTIVGSVTTWLPPSSTIQLKSQSGTSNVENGVVTTTTPYTEPLTLASSSTSVTLPGQGSSMLQGIADINGRKFIVVPRHNILSFSPNSSSAAPSFFHADPAPLADKTAISTMMTTQTQSLVASSGLKPAESSKNTTSSIMPSPSALIVNNAQSPGSVYFVPVVNSAAGSTSALKSDLARKNPPYMILNGFGGQNVLVTPQGVNSGTNTSAVTNTKTTVSTTSNAAAGESSKKPEESKKRKLSTCEEPPSKQPRLESSGINIARFTDHFMDNMSAAYYAIINIFDYLKVHELLRAARVCRLWNDIAGHASLWRTVRMKNSNVCDWDGFADALTRHNTQNLDLKKMLIPSKPSEQDAVWNEFCRVVGRVSTLRKIDLCRCPHFVVEHVANTCLGLRELSSLALRPSTLSLEPFENLKYLETLRLKSNGGFSLSGSLKSLTSLKHLKHLALTTVKDLKHHDPECLATFVNLESFEIGDCTELPTTFPETTLCKFTKLKRLRLENVGGSVAESHSYLKAMHVMKDLTQLELINFDVKSGFEKELPKNLSILKLLIIPSYVSQSATTNHTVLSAVLKMENTLTHFVWGVTHELLRVTELFVDQCEGQTSPKESKRSDKNDCIPVLKPVPGGQFLDRKSEESRSSPELDQSRSATTPQVEILELPKLHKLLCSALAKTKIRLLKIPFHATWRQYLSEMHG